MSFPPTTETQLRTLKHAVKKIFLCSAAVYINFFTKTCVGTFHTPCILCVIGRHICFSMMRRILECSYCKSWQPFHYGSMNQKKHYNNLDNDISNEYEILATIIQVMSIPLSHINIGSIAVSILITYSPTNSNANQCYDEENLHDDNENILNYNKTEIELCTETVIRKIL